MYKMKGRKDKWVIAENIRNSDLDTIFLDLHDQWGKKIKKSIFLTPQENFLEQDVSAEEKIILNDISNNLFLTNRKSNGLKRLLVT